MEKISQLMDGELDEREHGPQLNRLRHDKVASERWRAYHLIGDVLRHEHEDVPDICERVSQRLREEPTVLAPRVSLTTRLTRYTMPMAAAVAGVSVVAWLALQTQPASDSLPVTPKAAAPEMKGYLAAHASAAPWLVPVRPIAYEIQSSDATPAPAR